MEKSLKERINEIHNEIVEAVKNGSYTVAAVRKEQNYSIFKIIVEDAEFKIGVSDSNGATYYASDIIHENVKCFYASTDPVGEILTSEYLTTVKGERIKALKAELARLEEGGEQC